MRILEFEIENIRGIKNIIPLMPNGQNVVIFGPNGTGKSAVVDAIDFLFTGDISRLTGRGSKGMTLKDHGPHIDSEPKNAIIRAKVAFNDKLDPVKLERRMSNPKELIGYEGLDDAFKEALDVAAQGQHVLSRSEILRFVEAEAGQRSKETQALLNLSKVEDIRAAFVTINRDASKTLQGDKAGFEKSVAKVKAVLGLDDFSEEIVRNRVNEHRKKLNGSKLEALDLNKLKESISPKTQDKKSRVYPEQLKHTLKAIKEHIETKGKEVLTTENSLRSIVKKLKKDERLKRDLQNKKLLDLGISLVDDSGTCPLCLSEFEPGKLTELLKGRLSTAKEAEEIEKKITELSSRIVTEVAILKGHIELLSESSKKLNLENIEKDLCEWSKLLSEWSQALTKATEDYPVAEAPEATESFFSFHKWDEHHKKLGEIADSLEKSSPEQEAWDALTALEPVLERYFEDKEKYEASGKFAYTAKVLSDYYTLTKDHILEKLYNSVNTDFTTYYKFIHGGDEAGFDSELKPDGPHLEFRVEFYGRGKHHPRALHSEGHQDSMGLCLFLALNKKISAGKVGFVILDDVVMSIDSDHRKSVCKLITDKFPETQFIITTHNTTWARQLKSDKVVTEKNMVRFRGWSVDSGPKIKAEVGVWDDIERKVKGGDISEAAAKLREHLEFFFEMVSDSIKAKVPYKSDGRYELGDYIIGCKEGITKLIAKAKKSARNWGKEEDYKQFEKLETQTKEIIDRSQAEQWAINAAVHYNNWKDFSENDFLPIVEAFKDFEGMFKCSSCDGLISLGMQGVEPVSLKCPCGTINWNLEMKK
jgi:DNA repair exonuclease SbcCD ATPase subunit